MGVRMSKLPWEKISRPTIYPNQPHIKYRAIPEQQAQAGYEGVKEVIMKYEESKPHSSIGITYLDPWPELDKIIKQLKDYIGEENES